MNEFFTSEANPLQGIQLRTQYWVSSHRLTGSNSSWTELESLLVPGTVCWYEIRRKSQVTYLFDYLALLLFLEFLPILSILSSVFIPLLTPDAHAALLFYCARYVMLSLIQKTSLSRCSPCAGGPNSVSFLNITDAGNTSILPINAHSKQVSEGSSQVLIGLNSQGYM